MPPHEAVSTERPSADILRRGDWLIPYYPLIRHGDVQTILARYWPCSLDPQRYPTQSRFFATDADTTVLAKVNELDSGLAAEQRPTVLALHGLTACDQAPYMVTSARAALSAGFDSIRLNMRNCGGTEHLCKTLYHSGLTLDLRRVVDELAPRPVYILGYSMGGNIALKLAGEWGENAPNHVQAVCAVSPPVQLAMCSREIGRLRNRVYEQRFMRRLRAALRQKMALMPEEFPKRDLSSIKTIWQFDEEVTAPSFGFADAADYYRQSSSAAFIGDIRIPTLVLHAQDDPFIPFRAFDVDAFGKNPWISLLAPPHGGHVAFLGRSGSWFWGQQQAMRYFGAVSSAGG